MGEREDAADVVCEAAEVWVRAERSCDSWIHEEDGTAQDWEARYDVFRAAGGRLERAVEAWLLACREDEDDDE